MLNLKNITNENNKKHNKKLPFIPGHPYRILIIVGSGSWKTNALLNLISQQDDVDKTYLCAKNVREPKYEFLTKKREDVGIKHFYDPNAFTECSNTTDERLWEYWWLQPKQTKKKFNCVWWHGCRYYENKNFKP